MFPAFPACPLPARGAGNVTRGSPRWNQAAGLSAPPLALLRQKGPIGVRSGKVMAWVGTSGGGISGEMIRGIVLDCVERRFDVLRAPQPLQWLADNGSAYTAGETFAVALKPRRLLYPHPQPREQWRLRGLR